MKGVKYILKKVSVIVPVYNSEQYLNRCIESLLDQSYSNIEIMIVNDGSTDKSLNICEKYKKVDNRIVIINQENKGVGKARNTGLKNVTGNYIMWVDSDDYIEKNHIESFVNRIEESDYDVAIALEKVDILREENSIEIIKNLLLKKIAPHLWQMIFKKDAIKNISFENIPVGEDFIFIVEVFFNNKSFYIFEQNSYFYTYNEESIIHKNNLNIKRKIIEPNKKMSNIFSKNKLSKYYNYYMLYDNLLVWGGINRKKEKELVEVLKENIKYLIKDIPFFELDYLNKKVCIKCLFIILGLIK